MVETTKKKNRVFDYFCEEEQFSGGVAWCAGCPLELTARFVPKVLGKNMVFVGTPSCSAPVLHGQNVGAWHKLSYLACVMTGVASRATGLSRYFRRTAPVGKVGRGKPTASKNMPMVMLMHKPKYMATATLSHLEDFAKKLQKAKEKSKEGFVYLHVFSQCRVGWRIDSNMTIEVCRPD